MTFTPTAEQENIVTTALTGKDVIVQAYSGSSKTYTLTLVAKAMPEKKILYVAFNKAIATEASEKMPKNVHCRTVHSVAYGKTDKSILNKLKGEKPNNKYLAADLRIQGCEVWDKKAEQNVYLSPLRLIGWVNKTVLRFMQSSDDRLKMFHVYIDPDYSDLPLDEIKPMLLESAKMLWEKYKDPSDKLTIPHDVYLKLFALSGIDLGYDVVMLDESADCSPVMLSILASQKGSQKIYVGDSYQKIYSFTGSIDISTKVDAVRCNLTKSFRFGKAIADEANVVLGLLGSTTSLVGTDIESTVDTFPTPNAVVCRTNSGVLAKYIEELTLNPTKKINISCDTQAILHFAECLIELDEIGKSYHKYLKGFKSSRQFYKWLKETDEDVELEITNLANICKKLGAHQIVESLAEYCDRLRPDLVITTAHKSKGLEWDHVLLGDDYPDPYNSENSEEKRLFYVAMTRAKKSISGIGQYKKDFNPAMSNLRGLFGAFLAQEAETVERILELDGF